MASLAWITPAGRDRVGRAGFTFGGLTVPDHEGAQHVAGSQEVALCILPADALEEPPGGKRQGKRVNLEWAVLSRSHRHQDTEAFCGIQFSSQILLGKITVL